MYMMLVFLMFPGTGGVLQSHVLFVVTNPTN